MKKIILLFCLIILTGCGSTEPVVNAHYPDQYMDDAFLKENAFCQAVSAGGAKVPALPTGLPPWGYDAHFPYALEQLGYDHYGYKYVAPSAHLPAYAKAARLSINAEKNPEKRYTMCMSELGWKNRSEFSAKEKKDNDKNTRATALLNSMKEDRQSTRALRLVAAELRRHKPEQAAQERLQLMEDPGDFNKNYQSARELIERDMYMAERLLNDDRWGIELAHCSAMYKVVNENRQELIKRQPSERDRFMAQERETLDFATRMIHHDLALQEKERYARLFLEETKGNLTNILVRFQFESPKCSELVRDFKNREPQPDIIK